MGTNFYLMSKSKKLMRENFAAEKDYGITDEEYEIDPIFKDSRPTLHAVPCTEQEAEIYVPFCHRIYAEKERQARKRLNVHERYWDAPDYNEDPDYPFDWTEGEFS